MGSNDPLRRMSLAIGAGSVIALATLSPVFAGSGTPGSAGGAPSYDDIVGQYPVAALMAEVECDEDELVAGYTDNDDEQSDADELDAETESSDDEQGDDGQGDDDTPAAKRHTSNQSNDADEDEDEDSADDEADDEDDEHDDADEDDDSGHGSDEDESDDSNDD